MKRETILTCLCIVLVVALIIMVVFGCKCSREGFEVEAAKPVKPVADKATKVGSSDEAAAGSTPLTPKEQELFEALMKNDIADDKIQQLIKGGVLNEQLVERFLAKLDEGSAVAATAVTECAEGKAEPKTKKVAEVEGFQSGGYAKY